MEEEWMVVGRYWNLVVRALAKRNNQAFIDIWDASCDKDELWKRRALSPGMQD